MAMFGRNQGALSLKELLGICPACDLFVGEGEMHRCPSDPIVLEFDGRAVAAAIDHDHFSAPRAAVPGLSPGARRTRSAVLWAFALAGLIHDAAASFLDWLAKGPVGALIVSDEAVARHPANPRPS